MAAAALMNSARFLRVDAWCKKHVALIQIAMGLATMGLATFIAIVAISVHSQRSAEAKTVRVACERSKAFGPPLILFLERAENRLRTGALVQMVKIDGKFVPVLTFYRSTIPPSCPAH